jgi:hypothetical protein
MNQLPTIVTMFYNIRKKENGNESDNRQMNKYMTLAKEFILTLPYPLIIFIDESDNEELVEIINTARIHFSNKTLIIPMKLESTYYYQYYDRLHELQKNFYIMNGDVKHETPLYIILNNNKFFFIEQAIQQNPFSSSHFVWMDFGINHVSLNSEKIHEWILKVPDKIKQLCINPYIENTNEKEFFSFIYHHTAGGLFTGSAENLLKYADLFKKKVEHIYNDNWYQIDEAIMTMVQRDNPELFSLFYGDYQGIISNYFNPIHNIELILTGIDKAINRNKTHLAFEMIVFCLDFFIQNPDSYLLQSYIRQNIIVNYYQNNRRLLPEIIFLINRQILKKNYDIINLLYVNTSNINFYENKNLIIGYN